MNCATSAALVLVNWNSAELTIAAVRSAAQTAAAPVRLRLIVVDNGSTDNSVDRLHQELPHAEIIPLPRNLGFARAVNSGLRRVREPFAFILNADITFRNDAIGLLCQALAADEGAVLACPKLLRPDGSVQAAAVPTPTLFWELTNRSLARRQLHLHEHENTVVPGIVVPGIVGPCMAVALDRLEDIGLLDERFFFFFEETDWCRRITDAGFRVLYVPQAEVVHLQGESANRRPIRARVQFYASRYRYFHKHGGGTAVAVLFAGLFLRLTLNVFAYMLLTAVTLGRPRFRNKFAVAATLWIWHLLGCRPKWGFEN